MSADPVATRNDAYAHIADHVNERQQAILDVLSIGPMTDKAMAKRLGWPINRVTPRRGELVSQGLVVAAYEDRDEETKRRCVVWRRV